MKRQKLTFFPLAMTFLLSGCATLPDSTLNSDINSPVSVKDANISNADNQKEKAEIELNQNRSLWKGRKIASYSFVSEQFAGGLYRFVPVQIKVRNSKAISTKPIRKRLQLERIDGYDRFNTVEKMFDEIQTALDQENVVVITYNKEFGFPEKISISPVKSGTDSYFRVVVSNFEIIKPD